MAKKSYDLDPNHPVGRNILSQLYIYRGMYAEALAILEATQKVDAKSQWDLHHLGITYAKMGRQNDARGVITKLRDMSRTQYVMSYYVAIIYATLGDRDKAFDELELAYAARDWRLNFVKVEQFLQPLRDDPRYAVLVKRMNLPE